MRVSREEAEKNRKRVVTTAGALFREYGFDGIGIADLMKEAGLTHGGFYKQFGSKTDLEAEACATVMQENAGVWNKVTAHRPDDPLAALLRFYLSEKRLGEIREACGMATLAGEAARQGPVVRAAFTDGINRHLDQLAAVMPKGSHPESRRKAMAVLAEMVGALVLARAVDDPGLAGELLEAARKDLTDRFAD